ncbi:MAG TPA: zf-HC2 domain-containing protein [Candidatus Binatia bacterium]|nr:zf-HC2 domain-containing protein [Candidatus Binatia bacterium]
MTWTCLNTEERLSEYLEGRLEAAERLELQAHLETCAPCRRLAFEVGDVVARLGGLEPEVEPSWLVFRILQATTGSAPQQQESLWRRLLTGALSPRFALGLGSVVATLVILFQALGINPRRISADDFNPVNLFRAADRQAHLTYAHGVRFVNDLRVVYEIRSRLQDQEASATPSEPQRQEERNRPAGTASPQSERKLRNDLMLHHSSQIAVIALPGLPLGGPR